MPSFINVTFFSALLLHCILCLPSSGQSSLTLEQLNQKADDLLRRLDSLSVRSSTTPPQIPPSVQPASPQLPTVALDHLQVPEPNFDSVIPSKSSIFENDQKDQDGSFSSTPDDYQNLDFSFPKNTKNTFNFYFGFTLPNDTEFITTGKDAEFDTGFEIGLEYLRYFEDQSYLGGFIEGKFFESESVSGTSTTGDNKMISFGGLLGQNWELSEWIKFKTQLGLGASSSTYEFDSLDYSKRDLSFFYSFLLGFEFSLSQSLRTILYYEFDGRSEASKLDYHSFNQVGIKTGLAF